MSFSEFTQRDYEVIARNYAELKEAARKRCSGEQELAFRRENMRSTAEQIAQETQLRHICQENRDECPETA